jgi:hypothetical protein
MLLISLHPQTDGNTDCYELDCRSNTHALRPRLYTHAHPDLLRRLPPLSVFNLGPP